MHIRSVIESDVITDDSGESLEIYYAQHRFREAGYAAPIAATKKKWR